MELVSIIEGEEYSIHRNDMPPQPDNSLVDYVQLPEGITLIDDWRPTCPEDMIFKSVDKAIILPVSAYYKYEKSNDLDYFIISPKRCYNKPLMREHLTQYLNYFEKFYDTDHELLAVYCQMKFLMDFNQDYDKVNFISDLRKYILFNRSLLMKLYRLNEDNYIIELKAKKDKSIASLQYTTKHGKIMMQMSFLMNMTIPLITHFAHLKKIDNIDSLLLEIFDNIIEMSTVDIAAKIYETAITEINRNKNLHSVLWNMQDIRAKNTTTHAIASRENMILNIFPKYTYNNNIISFNFSSIKRNTRYKITDIKYEFNYNLFSSSNRDEDFNSEFDKFEAFMISQNEALYLQNKVSAQETMNALEMQFGPFDSKEIQFYMSHLTEDGAPLMNKFQKNKIFNLFYRYFGDPETIKAINAIDYVKLLIIAKRILSAYNMVILPYIIGGKVVKIPNKKSINKKELTKITSSPLWAKVHEKYQNPKIEEEILGQIGIILCGEFKIIDYEDEEINGKTIECIEDIVSEEYLLYVLMI